MAAGLARPRRLHDPRATPDGVVRRLEACQSPVWDTALALIALLDAGVARPTTRLVDAAADWLLDEEITVPGDWAVRRPDARRRAAGRSSSTTTATPTPTTPPRSCSRCGASRPGPAPGGAARSTAASPGWSACSRADGGLGRVRRRQHPRAAHQAAVLRLRRGHRPAVRRRHRARGRGARRRGTRRHGRRPARASRWLLRRTRSPTARGSAGGAPTTSTAPARWCRRWSRPGVAARPRRRSAGPSRWLEEHQNDDGGWGEDLRSYARPGLGRPRRVDRVADRVGAARAARRRRASTPAVGRAASPGWSTHQRAGRHLGRAAVHRHRLPRRLLHQLPPLPAGLPGHRARAATCAAEPRWEVPMTPC